MKVNILDNLKNEFVHANIEQIIPKDFDELTVNESFKNFNWTELKINSSEIYKLVYNENILGLIQFFHERLFNRLELNKLELSVENIGRGKKYDNIAGCLIAFTCLSSLKNHSGEVFIMPTKTTKSHYIEKYGFNPFNEYYVKSDRLNSERLIQKYLIN